MMFVFSTNLPGASCRITILTYSEPSELGMAEGQLPSQPPDFERNKRKKLLLSKALDYYLPRPPGISDPPMALLLHT